MCTEEEVGGWWPWNQDNGVSRAFPPKARFVVKHLYSTILLPFLIVVLSNTFQVAWKLVAISSFWMKLLWDIAWSREPWFGLVCFWFGFFFTQEACWRTDQAEPCFKRLLDLLSSHGAVKLVLRRLHFLPESFLNEGSCGCLLFF